MDVSLIFVNFRSALVLERALRSLDRARVPGMNYEVMVVNNDQEEVAQLNKLQQTHRFTLIANPINLGFGTAANQGAKIAKGQFLGFVNADSEWEHGTFTDIQSIFSEDEKVGIIGAKLVDNDSQPERWSGGQKATLFGLLLNNLPIISKLRANNALLKSENTAWVSGAALFIRKSLFEEMGGFDEAFFLYFEDMDLCQRVREKGFRIVKSPRLVVRHAGGGSDISLAKRKEAFYASQMRYFEKHRPSWETAVLRRLHLLRRRLTL